jgi:hypothetical protein
MQRLLRSTVGIRLPELLRISVDDGTLGIGAQIGGNYDRCWDGHARTERALSRLSMRVAGVAVVVLIEAMVIIMVIVMSFANDAVDGQASEMFHRSRRVARERHGHV